MRARCEPTSAEPSLAEATRMWAAGPRWKRYFFPAFWLVYLGQAVDGVAKHSHGLGALAGYLIIVAFAACYLAALPMGWDGAQLRVFWILYSATIGLTVAETFFAGEDALVFTVYLAVLTVASRRSSGIPAVAALVLATTLAPRFVPSWSGKINWDGGLTVFLVAFAMFGFFMIIRSNIELSAARSEVARLAAENERTRIARDLHDLLGHSLTTITVKAGLARRLSSRDPERAAEEIAAVEQLSRRTLVEVRAAVAGYRDVTLAGELATSQEVLRAAGIEAIVPGAVDGVDVDAVEPFGWVVREAVTNVVRHARAEHCTITVGPRWIEIVDDGHGAGSGAQPGNGLRGLSERLAAVGGTVTARSRVSGWTVRAELAPLAARPAGEARTVDA
jgi:two-component system, NarL family, sensor histidine kinase DesK